MIKEEEVMVPSKIYHISCSKCGKKLCDTDDCYLSEEARKMLFICDTTVTDYEHPYCGILKSKKITNLRYDNHLCVECAKEKSKEIMKTLLGLGFREISD